MLATKPRRPTRRPDDHVPAIDDRELAVRVRAIAARQPAVGLAVGVVDRSGLVAFAGHGVADVTTRRPVTADTGFRIASISKTMTAVAVLQLWEAGLVDLDAPANDYLRAIRLVPARRGFRPATVRHLLTHTAGLPEVAHPSGLVRPDFGESVPVGRPLPSLAEFYGGAVRVAADPGTRFVYGNQSMAILGQLVEDVTGVTLDRWFGERIFEPLGMAESDLLRTGDVAARLATGYALGPDGPRVVAERDMITAGAAQVFSTPRDMARYAAALLAIGEGGGGGRILRPSTVELMFAPHYRPDRRLPGMGLGFFRADLGGHPAVEHQGVHPGFDSQLLLAPDDGLGVIAFTNGTRLGMFWLPAETGRLLGDVLGIAPAGVRTDVPHRPATWPELCGWYAVPAGLTDVRLRGFVGAGLEVFVRDGRPWLRMLTPVPALYRGFELHPDDPDDPTAFRVAAPELGLGSVRVVFGRDPLDGATSIHLDVMPLSGYRRPAATNPKRRLARAVATVGAVGLAAGAARRRRRARRRTETATPTASG